MKLILYGEYTLGVLNTNSLGEAITILHYKQNIKEEFLSQKVTPKRDVMEQRIGGKFVFNSANKSSFAVLTYKLIA